MTVVGGANRITPFSRFERAWELVFLLESPLFLGDLHALRRQIRVRLAERTRYDVGRDLEPHVASEWKITGWKVRRLTHRSGFHVIVSCQPVRA